MIYPHMIDKAWHSHHLMNWIKRDKKKKRRRYEVYITAIEERAYKKCTFGLWSALCIHGNSKVHYIIMSSVFPFQKVFIHLRSARCYQGFRSPGGPAVQFRILSPGFKKTLSPCGSLRASPFRIWWNASPG